MEVEGIYCLVLSRYVVKPYNSILSNVLNLKRLTKTSRDQIGTLNNCFVTNSLNLKCINKI